MLFWLFVLVEILLIVFYIAIPIFKIYGIKKGISEVDASIIIGKHFPEVKDKLLNMLQLKNLKQNSDLINASIEQKSNELKPIPFKSAIDFSGNKKYVKYVLIPIAIWLLAYSTGNVTIFNDSLTRVVHYNTAYEAPAPFSFKVLNESLNVIEGAPFSLQVEAMGNTIPEDAIIHFPNGNYYLENIGLGKFQYNFTSVKKSSRFFIEANGVASKEYALNIIATPVITNLKMILKMIFTGELIKNYPTLMLHYL